MLALWKVSRRLSLFSLPSSPPRGTPCAALGCPWSSGDWTPSLGWNGQSPPKGALRPQPPIPCQEHLPLQVGIYHSCWAPSSQRWYNLLSRQNHLLAAVPLAFLSGASYSHFWLSRSAAIWHLPSAPPSPCALSSSPLPPHYMNLRLVASVLLVVQGVDQVHDRRRS